MLQEQFTKQTFSLINPFCMWIKGFVSNKMQIYSDFDLSSFWFAVAIYNCTRFWTLEFAKINIYRNVLHFFLIIIPLHSR